MKRGGDISYPSLSSPVCPRLVPMAGRGKHCHSCKHSRRWPLLATLFAGGETEANDLPKVWHFSFRSTWQPWGRTILDVVLKPQPAVARAVLRGGKWFRHHGLRRKTNAPVHSELLGSWGQEDICQRHTRWIYLPECRHIDLPREGKERPSSRGRPASSVSNSPRRPNPKAAS